MSRVIKNNDGVAVVEGTPAASLVKDVDKFFATKLPERMAGENIAQKRTLDPRAINTRRPTPKDLEQMNNPPNVSPEDNMMFMGGSKDFNEKTGRVESRPQSERTDEERRANLEAFDRLSEERKRERTINTRRPLPKRNEARDKAESRRERFFERRKYAERSQREQEATQGKFITTLRT